MRQSKKHALTPTEDERNLIHRMRYEGVDLTDFFDEYQFRDKMGITKDRIIGLFVSETDPATGRPYAGNYLPMQGDDVEQLARYAFQHVRGIREIARWADIGWYRLLPPYWGDMVLRSVRYELVLQQLLQMRARGELWRTGCGKWEVTQSVVDEFAVAHQATRQYFAVNTEPAYRDERSHHGKPSKQSRRRDSLLRQAPGLSISHA